MEVTCDARVDVLRIIFTDAPIAESDEVKPGNILDFAEDGSLIGLKLLDASKHMSSPDAMEYAVVGLQSA
jgi:uncharacterized protein YuzE